MCHHASHNIKPKKKIYCNRKADWASLQIELENITATYFQLNETNLRSIYYIQENWDYFFYELLIHTYQSNLFPMLKALLR